MAERRPASDEAPPRGETPSQAEQRLLVVGVCSWFCLPAPQAPNVELRGAPLAARPLQRLVGRYAILRARRGIRNLSLEKLRATECKAASVPGRAEETRARVRRQDRGS